MTRINLFSATAVRSTTVRTTPATFDSVAWGKSNINFDKNTGTLVFAALLIVCSLAVGCSSEKPKTESSTSQTAMTQPTTPPVTPATEPAPAAQASAKPVHKKVVRKVPATVTYADKTSGVSFQYPRKYALETGTAASELVSSDPLPMDFVQPGGVALAAVALPESAYPNSDLASAFFGVSINKELTTEQCGGFSETKPSAPADATTSPETAPSVHEPSKLIIGDMELLSSETIASQGTREVASKYYHVFENGACYEFALKVATMGIENQGGATHVDREKVFQRLEKILATVKIEPAVPEVTANAPATSSAPGTPAQ